MKDTQSRIDALTMHGVCSGTGSCDTIHPWEAHITHVCTRCLRQDVFSRYTMLFCNKSISTEWRNAQRNEQGKKKTDWMRQCLLVAVVCTWLSLICTRQSAVGTQMREQRTAKQRLWNYFYFFFFLFVNPEEECTIFPPNLLILV